MKDTMTTRRWNQFIDFANANRPVTELVPPIQNEQERRIFEDMTSRLAEMRKTAPGASYSNVDMEWCAMGDHEGYYD